MIFEFLIVWASPQFVKYFIIFTKFVGTCLYFAFLEGRFSFATSISITKPMGFKLKWNKCSITHSNIKIHDLVPCCPKGLSPQLEIFYKIKGFSVAFHFSNTSNVVVLSFKVDAFEVREMDALMLDLDLKGCKLHGGALLSFGLIWNFPASKDPEHMTIETYSLIDNKMGNNSTIWNVDQHNVEVQTSYGFSRHTKVVDIIALTWWVQAKVDHLLCHIIGLYKVSCIYMSLRCHKIINMPNFPLN